MLRFTWAVAKGGYRWTKNRQHEMFLVEAPGGPLGARSYRPLEECPELFAKFARLETPAEILAFVNQYGPPWTSWDTAEDAIPESKLVAMGEKGEIPPRTLLALSTLREMIHSLREAVEVWECLQKGYKHRLGQKITWRGNAVVYDPEAPGEPFKIADDQQLYPHIFATWQRGEVIGPAKLFLAQRVNKHIGRTVGLRLILNEAGEFESSFAPLSLYWALWLQLHLAAAGVKRFIECEVCGEWMEITDQNRKTKKAHTVCRKRIWAQKQKVLSLSRAGRPVEEIVSATGYEESVVRGWVKEPKTGKKGEKRDAKEGT